MRMESTYDDLKEALKGFLLRDDLLYSEEEALKEQQRLRLKQAGFENYEWFMAQCTKPEDHFLYRPENLKCETTKKILDLQKNERNAVS